MKAALPRSEWEEEGSFYSTVLLKVALLPGKLGAIKKKKKAAQNQLQPSFDRI